MYLNFSDVMQNIKISLTYKIKYICEIHLKRYYETSRSRNGKWPH